MRTVFALLALIGCASSAAAEPVVQDRYGPPRSFLSPPPAPVPAEPAAAAPATGQVAAHPARMLGWSGKGAAQAAAPVQLAARTAPAPTPRPARIPAPAETAAAPAKLVTAAPAPIAPPRAF